mmetsp:Transcript_71238/g.112835  ORF Transcript_71238/g.112835 Transcript_71238/m.112835 type:complete len:228 (+) Transcript_71238:106-789(+)
MTESVLAQIAEAEKFKQEGNAKFKEQNFQKALAAYWKVFTHVNGLTLPGQKSEADSYAGMLGRSTTGNQVPADKVEDVKRLTQSTHLNMAACYLKQSKHQKCIDACTKALEHGPISKAFFRRGQANLELRNLDEAKSDFEKARELEPNDATIVAELRRLQVAFKQHEQKEKAKFKGMFDKISKEKMEEEEEEVEDPTKQGEAPVAEVGSTETSSTFDNPQQCEPTAS